MSDIKQVIFIDDEQDVREAGRQTLELEDFAVTCFASAEAALAALDDDFPGVIVSDVRLPDMDGLRLMAVARERDRDLPVVLITGHGDISMAVEAMRAGAYDFIEKPFPAERLLESVRRAMDKRALVMENRTLRRALEDATDRQGPLMVGSSAPMKALFQMIGAVAASDADVLIMGETGTGKELVARALHARSPRRKGNFVAVNCGALPETVIESELFGHEAGAFTGANQRRIGKIEHASGGTLFLDEIESMPMALQVKLLRVLQERVLERLGSNTAIPLDLRVLAASKVCLRTAANEGTFREDLYYRLNVMTLDVPPLRDRRDDIPLLFQHFAQDAAGRFDKPAPILVPEHLARLMAHAWPGNVRELRNIAERYVLLDGAATALPGSMAPDDTQAAPAASAGSLPDQVAAFERGLIAQALARHEGCVRRTSEALGLPRKTLHDKMRRLGLERHDFAAD